MVWADQGAKRNATGGCVSIRRHLSCCLHRQQLPRLKELLRGIPMLKLWWSLQTRNNRSCTSWPILLTSPGAQHVCIEHDLIHIDELEKLTTQASPSSLWTSVWRRRRMACTHNQREHLTTKELFGWCWHVARLAILEWFQSKAKVRSTTWPTKCWALCRALGMLKLVSTAIDFRQWADHQTNLENDHHFEACAWIEDPNLHYQGERFSWELIGWEQHPAHQAACLYFGGGCGSENRPELPLWTPTMVLGW